MDLRKPWLRVFEGIVSEALTQSVEETFCECVILGFQANNRLEFSVKLVRGLTIGSDLEVANDFCCALGCQFGIEVGIHFVQGFLAVGH